MGRPVLFVLAGVNGAGKSSVGGQVLVQAGLDGFNPDSFARELLDLIGCSQADANTLAWTEGLRRLDEAVAQGRSHAFETTLGGKTLVARIEAAARSHEVMVWYGGLVTPEPPVARVKARVAAGGHDIPEATVRARWQTSMANLIRLLPCRTWRNCRSTTTATKLRPARRSEIRCCWPRGWPAVSAARSMPSP